MLYNLNSKAKETWEKMVREVLREFMRRGYFNIRINQGYIIALKKEKFAREPNDYRTVTMTNIIIKIIKKMGQLTAISEGFYNLNRRQMGFTNKADCNLQKDVFFTTLLKHFNWAKAKGAILFVDVKKVFDSVNRQKIVEKCKERGGELFELIAKMTWGLRIRLENCIHGWIWVDKGVTQGSCLGPMLFNIAMEDFPDLEEKGIFKREDISNVRMYADDLVFIATNQKTLQEM